MGAVNKLLLDCGGVPMIRRVVDTLTGCGDLAEIVVVLGFEADRVSAALEGAPIRTVVNPEFAGGQMTSVRVGLGALATPGVGVLICLGDQPTLTAADIGAICRAYGARERGSVLVPTYRGQRGNPIVLDPASIDDILGGGRKFGCRQFIASNADLVATAEIDTERIIRDIDRPEDYAALGAGPSRLQ